MENFSILDPPITDILNDPRVTSRDLIQLIQEQQRATTKTISELSARLKPEELGAYNGMMFALLQQHLHVTTLTATLAARSVDYAYKAFQLTLALERLTKWLIGLTVVLGAFALPLAIEVVLRWLQ